MIVSVVIRTYNEERYLGELLDAIAKQNTAGFDVETVIVDSGSTDGTLGICSRFDCKIVHIDKEQFSFGRSLNIGCLAASGSVLVFISGHCVPAGPNWISELTKPILDGVSSYSYGRQIGRDTTKFSEYRLFEKYFPRYSKIPQDGFFCNNANSALTRAAWEAFRFNEELTGLEDMYLAKSLVEDGKTISYIAEAAVHHIHDESWAQVRYRYEREAIALKQVMPELHLSFLDFLKYFVIAVLSDFKVGIAEKVSIGQFIEILAFRLMQYWGSYRGNHEHRKLSAKMKKLYFYPKDLEKAKYVPRKKSSSFATNEGK